jgi:hypothetical protein
MIFLAILCLAIGGLVTGMLQPPQPLKGKVLCGVGIASVM